MSTAPKKIHALYGLGKMTDPNVTPLLDASVKGLGVNSTVFSKPPVDMVTYQTAITAYETAIPVANDGSKTAIAQKNKLRGVAIEMYIQLAHYVEANCNNDMATFLLSGFQAASSTRTPPAPLVQPTVKSAVPATVTGSMLIRVNTVDKALSYDLRNGAVPAAGGAPTTWTQQALTTTKTTTVTGLTPGTTYMFQVRALGRLGYTNWSDGVSRMAN